MSPAANRPAPQEVWDQLSQAERDAAYNNSAAVPTSAAWVAARDIAAAAFRAEAKAHLDLAYGPGDRQKLDVYPGTPGLPCLVFIHWG